MSPKEMHEAIPRFVAGRQKLDSQKLLVRGAKQRDDGDRFLERQLSQCTPLPVEALPVACPDPLLGL
jgi:hypothetical protein